MGFVLSLSEYMVLAVIAIPCSCPCSWFPFEDSKKNQTLPDSYPLLRKQHWMMKKWGIKKRFPLLDAPEMILIPGLRRPLFDVTLAARYGAGWFSFHLECLMAALAIFMNGLVMEMRHFLCIAHASSFIG